MENPLTSETESAVPLPVPSLKLNFGWRVLLGMSLGIVQALCFPPVGLAFLLPLCVAGFLVLLNGLDVKQSFRLGFLYALAWYFADLFWLANIFGPAALSLCAIMAFFVGLFAGLYAWLGKRIPWLPLSILAAILWTGVEVYRSELFILNFGWLGLGYGVVNSPVLAIAASWFGCYGLTFAIVAIASVIANVVFRGRRNVARPMVIFAAWLLLYAMPLPIPTPTHPLKVLLVQANSEDDQSLFSLSRVQPTAAYDAIVWPEYSFVSDPTHQKQLWAKLQSVAIENHAYFIFGAKDEFNPADPAGYRNTAYVIDPTGHLIGRHVKNHTVHFFRDGVPGKIARAMATDLGRIGVGICFDMDYPDVARRLAEDGAEVFLIPNDDPAEWGPVQRSQHRLMFQMRAAECGRWLARADVAGGTSVARPDGSEAVRIGTSGPGSLSVTVGRLKGKTFFLRGGWMFGRACLGAIVGIVAWAIVAGRMRKKRKVACLLHRSDRWSLLREV